MPIDTAQEEGPRLGTLHCWAAGLDALHARIAPRFRRAEVRARARRYLAGLLGRAERKNGWQLAEALGEPGPHGVQRQYSGTAGRRENSQVGVFLVYATPRGRAFLDRALYLPASWAEDAPRRGEAGVPPAVQFATKPQLAKAMLQRAFAAGVPAAWVVGDTVYGTAAGMRPWLEGQRRAYVLAVPSTHRAWTGRRQATARAAVAGLPAAAWARRSAGDGSQGPRWYDWAWLPLAGTAATGAGTGSST